MPTQPPWQCCQTCGQPTDRHRDDDDVSTAWNRYRIDSPRECAACGRRRKRWRDFEEAIFNAVVDPLLVIGEVTFWVVVIVFALRILRSWR
jgi:hypothetical protein